MSEFDECNLTPEYHNSFAAPFVAESNIKLGMKFENDIEIEANGTRLIIGKVQEVSIEDDFIESDGQIDLEKANDVCVTGLNQYSSVSKFTKIPYARLSEVPDFKKEKRPDNVVFDKETQSYNAGLLPYGTNIGAPSVKATGVSSWVNTFNHAFKNKIELISRFN